MFPVDRRRGVSRRREDHFVRVGVDKVAADRLGQAALRGQVRRRRVFHPAASRVTSQHRHQDDVEVGAAVLSTSPVHLGRRARDGRQRLDGEGVGVVGEALCRCQHRRRRR